MPELQAPIETAAPSTPMSENLLGFTTLNSPDDPLQQVEQDLLVCTISKAKVQLDLCGLYARPPMPFLPTMIDLCPQEMNLSPQQAQALQSVVRQTHLTVTSSEGTREECFAAFKAALITTCVHRSAIQCDPEKILLALASMQSC